MSRRYLGTIPGGTSEILAGRWDHVPEQAFLYVGRVEEAAAKASAAQMALA